MTRRTPPPPPSAQPPRNPFAGAGRYVSLRLSAQHVNFPKLCAFLLTIGILQLLFLQGTEAELRSRTTVGGVIPGQRQRSRATDVAQSFCLPAHPRIVRGINASAAPLLFAQVLASLLKRWHCSSRSKVWPKFASARLLFFPVDNIDAEHMWTCRLTHLSVGLKFPQRRSQEDIFREPTNPVKLQLVWQSNRCLGKCAGFYEHYDRDLWEIEQV